MRLYSEENVGTTIQLTLPCGAETNLREAPMQEALPIPGEGQSILLAKDERDLLEMTTNVLEDQGYSVLRAQSGEMALQIAQVRADIDLLLTDVVMPGHIDGFELAKRIRALRPEIPVLYTSGHTGFTAVKMRDMRAPLLQKPCPPAKLAEVISDALKT
ncbi:response regulator [Roseobacter sp.]|uniref:response regulator n=1 Tax=Roseobacter sp. TaxID=1907202 RepID=UPI0032971A6A